MTPTSASNWSAAITLIVLAAIVFAAGYHAASSRYQKQAIKNGSAQYNSVTGDWEWIDHGSEAGP